MSSAIAEDDYYENSKMSKYKNDGPYNAPLSKQINQLSDILNSQTFLALAEGLKRSLESKLNSLQLELNGRFIGKKALD